MLTVSIAIARHPFQLEPPYVGCYLGGLEISPASGDFAAS